MITATEVEQRGVAITGQCLKQGKGGGGAAPGSALGQGFVRQQLTLSLSREIVVDGGVEPYIFAQDFVAKDGAALIAATAFETMGRWIFW